MHFEVSINCNSHMLTTTTHTLSPSCSLATNLTVGSLSLPFTPNPTAMGHSLFLQETQQSWVSPSLNPAIAAHSLSFLNPQQLWVTAAVISLPIAGNFLLECPITQWFMSNPWMIVHHAFSLFWFLFYSNDNWYIAALLYNNSDGIYNLELNFNWVYV